MTQTVGCIPILGADLCIGNNAKLAIQGAGASTTIIDGNSLQTVIGVQTGSVLTVTGVTVTHGNAPNGSGKGGGGFFNGGTLALTDALLRVVVHKGAVQQRYSACTNKSS